jgi:hypothetical protein
LVSQLIARAHDNIQTNKCRYEFPIGSLPFAAAFANQKYLMQRTGIHTFISFMTLANVDWANKAVADIDREELIANLQSASGDDAFQYLHSHLADFPTSVQQVRAIGNAILAKLNVSFRVE